MVSHSEQMRYKVSTILTKYNIPKQLGTKIIQAKHNGTKKSLVPFVPNPKNSKNGVFLAKKRPNLPKNAINNKIKKTVLNLCLI